MSSRFPSLEEFDAGHTSIASGDAANDGGSFLDRERAALGDDADFFTNSGDNMPTVDDVGDDDGDLLGGGKNSYQPDDMQDDMSGFESSFPTIGTQDRMTPGGPITGSSFPIRTETPNSYPAPSYREQANEPEVIQNWRKKRDADIAARDEISAERKAQTIKQAQQDIDDFYNNFNDKKEKTIAQTRKAAEEFLNARDDTTAGGTSWERIGKLVDLSGKGSQGGAGGSGKERMREILISLRKDEKAPGATGY